MELQDARLAKIIKQCEELPGQEIFEYFENGKYHDVKSDDVNEYLRTVSSEHFTAKDFRTWAGTLLAAQALKRIKIFHRKPKQKSKS